MFVQTVLVLAALLLARFIYTGYVVRTKFRRLRALGCPMPPHHPILGHLLILGEATKALPKDAFPGMPVIWVAQKYPELGDVFYLDVWPMSAPIVVIGDPDLGTKVIYDQSIAKHTNFKGFLGPLTDAKDMINLEGQEWKFWRAAFNPGFQPLHISSLVPIIIDEVETFRKKLAERAAKKELFKMEPLAMSLTLDIIGRAVLNEDFACQIKDNRVVQALRNLIDMFIFAPGFELRKTLDPTRWFRIQYYRWILDTHLRKAIRRFYETSQTTDSGKTAVELALKAIGKSQTGKKGMAISRNVEDYVLAQVKLMLFAGHDTTANSICYVFGYLSSHPECLTKLREEHDTVFGKGISASDALRVNSHLLNSLPYTTACIKESLRLQPIVNIARHWDGCKTLASSPQSAKHASWLSHPVEGSLLMVMTAYLHRNPRYVVDPHSFRPERFLAAEGDELALPKGFWRAFSHGPRNCIGQELAMTEMKCVLALTAREMDVKTAYEELDRMRGYKDSEIHTVNGERAYATNTTTTMPSDGMPVRVTII